MTDFFDDMNAAAETVLDDAGMERAVLRLAFLAGASHGRNWEQDRQLQGAAKSTHFQFAHRPTYEGTVPRN